MNEYNSIVIARTEYQQRNQSIAPVLEYGENVRNVEPGWLSKQAGHLLSIIGNGLAALGKRLTAYRNRQPFQMPENGQRRGASQRLSQ